jgi:cytochrome c-type biogenesis protein CcmF
MTETGHIALVIAFVVAIFAAAASMVGAGAGSRRLVSGARTGVLVVFGLFTLAFALILYAFVSKDFSLSIVAEHSSRDLSAIYTLSALYAGKAGSIFFWGWLISLFTALLVLWKRDSQQPGMPYTLAILGIIQIFFLGLVTFGSNVFEKVPNPPVEGVGLNPLLQNLGMLIHPPLLYLGFAGFAVVFALVIGSLITRRTGAEWAVESRRWAVFAWCALGLGNLLGMWWSYNELGWGGYWAWDPVENAGLMPWLLGTAFLHSVSVRRRRNYLHNWSLLLIIFTFALTLFSPFVTHGGIESPLHGFYGSPFPPYILAAIVVALIGPLIIVNIRSKDSGEGEKPASLISREGAFLLTNIILVVLVLIIFAGTVMPRIVEGVGGTSIALERSFFDRTCGPIMLVLVFLMGICPLLGWGKAAWHSIKRNFLYAFIAAVVIAIAILASGAGNWYAVAAVVCGLPLFTVCLEWYRGTRGRHAIRRENHIRAFFSFINSNRARYGGFLVHIGVILIALGIIASSFYEMEKTVTLDIGDTVGIGDYQLTYSERLLKQDNVKVSAVASMSVSRNGRLKGVMNPSYDYWFLHEAHFAEVAVRTTPAEDLFVSLVWTDYDPADKVATFRVLVNPLIVWMWVGGGFFLLGGAIAFSLEEKQAAGGEG